MNKYIQYIALVNYIQIYRVKYWTIIEHRTISTGIQECRESTIILIISARKHLLMQKMARSFSQREKCLVKYHFLKSGN